MALTDVRLVRYRLLCEPLAGPLFSNTRRNRLKLLYRDSTLEQDVGLVNFGGSVWLDHSSSRSLVAAILSPGLSALSEDHQRSLLRFALSKYSNLKPETTLMNWRWVKMQNRSLPTYPRPG
jgi:hypothetical protein